MKHFKDLASKTAPSVRQLTYIALKSYAGAERGQASAEFLHQRVTNIKLHHEIELLHEYETDSCAA